MARDTFYPVVRLTDRQWDLVMWELNKHRSKEVTRIREYIFAQVDEARIKHEDYLRRSARWGTHPDGQADG